MSLAAERWPAYVEPQARGTRSVSKPDSVAGALAVWRIENAKLSGMIKIRAMAVLSLIGPFLVVWFLNLQSATPGDTPFGQWVHTSGLAIPMTILGFGAQWILPAITAVVAGDIYSADDHYGTWKTILTRSCTRELGDAVLDIADRAHRPERRALPHEHPEVEVRAMHDDSVLLAVESALSRPAFCNCGDQLRLATRDHALWLECPAFEAPSRLPGGVMHVLRELIHERRHVVDLPEVEPEARAPEFAA